MKKQYLFIIAAIILIAAGIIYRASNPVSTATTSEKLKSEKQKHDAEFLDAAAYLAAKDFIFDRLKAPSTASFSKMWDDYTRITSRENNFTVRIWVDSQNTFGAMLRTNYTVEIIYNPTSETWSLIRLTKSE